MAPRAERARLSEGTAVNGSANGTMPSTKRPIRIAGSSGGFTDRQRAILSLAKCDVDVIVGDWMVRDPYQCFRHSFTDLPAERVYYELARGGEK